MKLMYLTFQEDAPLYIGVKNKIEGQICAFEKLGYEVSYSMWKKNQFDFYGANPKTYPINSSHGKMKQFAKYANEYFTNYSFDVLYFRIDRVSYDVIRICRTVRENKSKTIVVEVPNFPYISDYIRNIRCAKGLKSKILTAVKVAVTVVNDRISGLVLKNYVDAAVLYGNRSNTFFGVKAMNGENGVNIEKILPIESDRRTEKDIFILGVAGTLWWQGYDRILQGMSTYKKQKKSEDPAVKFVLVGGDATEMPEFKSLAEDLGLSEDVIYYGFKSGNELESIYHTVDLGASSLGCYRRGLTYCSSLKAREYCAAALPFIYAYEDENLDNLKGTFALKISNNSDPVDIGQVIEFVQNCRNDPSIAKKEREFAEQYYDWKNIMKNILDFANK